MTFNPTYIEQLSSQVQNYSSTTPFSYIIARVTHVVQGPYLLGTKVKDDYYNDPTDLGVITFQLLKGPQDSTLDSSGNNTAKPMFSAVKQYPLENELVLVVPGPSTFMNEARGRRDFFYLFPYNTWNSSHQNAFPDLGDYTAFVNAVRVSYNSNNSTRQSINTSATGSLTMPLGPNFPEKHNVRALRQFTGDVTIEGRWGNSIRFGSTIAIDGDENYWSKNSTPGNPITIIRNGQGRQENKIPWVPTVENINRDPSSIYLTQGQQIIIDDISNNFSLLSLGVSLERTVTTSIPIQQQLTSIDTISPFEQDNSVSAATQNTSQ